MKTKASCKDYIIRSWIQVALGNTDPRNDSTQTERETLFSTLILHGVDDDCEQNLNIAAKLVRNEQEIQEVLCIEALMLRDWREWINNGAPEKEKVIQNDVQEEVGWLCRKSLSLSPRSNHFLHVVFPVLVVKLESLRCLKRHKRLNFKDCCQGHIQG